MQQKALCYWFYKQGRIIISETFVIKIIWHFQSLLQVNALFWYLRPLSKFISSLSLLNVLTVQPNSRSHCCLLDEGPENVMGLQNMRFESDGMICVRISQVICLVMMKLNCGFSNFKSTDRLRLTMYKHLDRSQILDNV